MIPEPCADRAFSFATCTCLFPAGTFVLWRTVPNVAPKSKTAIPFVRNVKLHRYGLCRRPLSLVRTHCRRALPKRCNRPRNRFRCPVTLSARYHHPHRCRRHRTASVIVMSFPAQSSWEFLPQLAPSPSSRRYSCSVSSPVEAWPLPFIIAARIPVTSAPEWASASVSSPGPWAYCSTLF